MLVVTKHPERVLLLHEQFVSTMLHQCRAELAEKQLKLIEREKELLDKDQTVSTLREEVIFVPDEGLASCVL